MIARFVSRPLRFGILLVLLGVSYFSDQAVLQLPIQILTNYTVPSVSLVARLGMSHASKEYKFYNTNLSGIIKHAFQALALDERRRPFAPAVWERKSTSRDTTTDLRQVWFPGAHSNVGGGYDDQELANVSLAW
jgi:hypothetical protein